MENKWEEAVESLSKIKINASPINELVTIKGHADGMRCIGVGTDAAVFRHDKTPEFAFKLYADESLYKKELESKVYEQLGDSNFFAKMHGVGDRYLVLSYESGTTLYDCLLQGIYIPEKIVEDVEEAREYVRQQNLNPRDIHLKNILFQDGRAKILDVSEYAQSGNDFRWEHLRKGYEQYYHLIAGKPVPLWIVESTRKWYKQASGHSLRIDEFLKRISNLALYWKT